MRAACFGIGSPWTGDAFDTPKATALELLVQPDKRTRDIAPINPAANQSRLIPSILHSFVRRRVPPGDSLGGTPSRRQGATLPVVKDS